MTDFYRFPAMANLSELDNERQTRKIQSEAIEAGNASWDYGMALRNNRDTIEMRHRAYGMELMDVIHSVETAIRMEFTDEEVCELRDAVIEKNRKRGYYDD